MAVTYTTTTRPQQFYGPFFVAVVAVQPPSVQLLDVVDQRRQLHLAMMQLHRYDTIWYGGQY